MPCRDAGEKKKHATQATARWRRVADQLGSKVPKRATLMDQAEPDVLSCMSFPAQRTRCVTLVSITPVSDDPIIRLPAVAA